jgi:hypothetical protein
MKEEYKRGPYTCGWWVLEPHSLGVHFLLGHSLILAIHEQPWLLSATNKEIATLQNSSANGSITMLIQSHPKDLL